MRLQNGECVTEIFAPPTLGLSALALRCKTSELPSGLTLSRIVNSTLALYGQRAGEDGLIYAQHNDELTNGSTFTPLAQALKRDGKVMDPAVNALAVINGRAISEIITGSPDVDALPASLAHTDAFKSEEALLTRLHDDRAKGPFTHPEQVLAAVRLGRSADLVTDAELASIFSPTHAGGSHPERHGLSVTENIEIARLLPDREESHIYLARVLGKIAKSGAITRYEDAIPGHNPIKNKMNRRQLWLPTAAEIVQIDPNLY